MITEAITIGAILGASAAAAWLAKVKFQPEIERQLAKVDAEEKTIVARKSAARA